ncbi:MAG: DUF2304 domain-containing protein [Saprospiraceae bacterium]
MFELYQIIVPLVSLVFIWSLLQRFWRGTASWQETLVGMFFWVAVILFSFFPDFFSNLLARVFGIKSNINAVIFFCLGLIFFFQYKLFFLFKQQQTALTELTRKIALQDQEKGKE